MRKTALVNGFGEAVFRANPRYQLVTGRKFAAQELSHLAPFLRRQSDASVLVPRRSSMLSAKVLAPPTASLFRALRKRSGSVLPGEWRAAATPHSLAGLVWDGVLEVEHRGAFISGPAACAAMSDVTLAITPRHRLGRISIDAVRYGEALQGLSPSMLFSRLYSFYRMPLVPLPGTQTRTAREVHAWLCPPASRLRRRLEQHWSDGSTFEPGGWLSWANKKPGEGNGQIYKLYVSPADASAMPEVFERLVDVLTDGPAIAIKIANDMRGLARPDKCIAYFSSAEHLQNDAARLTRELAGTQAHGVPFTAMVPGSDGWLSWAIDPPNRKPAWDAQGSISWRYWIVSRLVSSLVVAAGTPGSALPPWRFALERLRLDGVDPESWRADQVSWVRQRGSEAAE